jgi:hypothetical protein
LNEYLLIHQITSVCLLIARSGVSRRRAGALSPPLKLGLTGL